MTPPRRTGMWIPVGLAAGVALGLVMRNLALGIGLGLAVGGLATVLAARGGR